MSPANLLTPVAKFNNELCNSVTEGLRQQSKPKDNMIQAFNMLNQNKSVLTNEIIRSTMQQDSSVTRSNNSSQFTNERRSSQNSQISNTMPMPSEMPPPNQIDKLKKKIIEGNFSEPKSLFKGIDLGSGSSMKNKLRQHAFDYSQKKMLSDSKTTSKMD